MNFKTLHSSRKSFRKFTVSVLPALLFCSLQISMQAAAPWNNVHFNADNTLQRAAVLNSVDELFTLEQDNFPPYSSRLHKTVSGIPVLTVNLPSGVSFRDGLSGRKSSNQICNENNVTYVTARSGSDAMIYAAPANLSPLTLETQVTCTNGWVEFHAITAANGEIVVVGSASVTWPATSATLAFGGLPPITVTAGTKFVAKYSLLTGWDWNRQIGYTTGAGAIVSLEDIAIDNAGNIFVTGVLNNASMTLVDIAATPHTISSTGQNNFLLLLDGQGWYNPTWGTKLKVAPNNWIAGSCLDVKIDPDQTAVYFTASDFIEKHALSGSGTLIWSTQLIPGISGAPLYVNQIELNACDELYAAGVTEGSNPGLSSCGLTFFAECIDKVTTATQWVANSTSPASYAASILADSQYLVHVTGSFGLSGNNCPQPMVIDASYSSGGNAGNFIGDIDDMLCSSCWGIPSTPAGVFVPVFTVTNEPSFYGPIPVHNFICDDPIIFDGSASNCETDYFIEIDGFDLGSWQPTNSVYSGWFSGQAPASIDVLSFFPPGNPPQCDVIYKFRLGVGPVWGTIDLWFRIDCGPVPLGTTLSAKFSPIDFDLTTLPPTSDFSHSAYENVLTGNIEVAGYTNAIYAGQYAGFPGQLDPSTPGAWLNSAVLATPEPVKMNFNNPANLTCLGFTDAELLTGKKGDELLIAANDASENPIVQSSFSNLNPGWEEEGHFIMQDPNNYVVAVGVSTDGVSSHPYIVRLDPCMDLVYTKTFELAGNAEARSVAIVTEPSSTSGFYYAITGTVDDTGSTGKDVFLMLVDPDTGLTIDAVSGLTAAVAEYYQYDIDNGTEDSGESIIVDSNGYLVINGSCTFYPDPFDPTYPAGFRETQPYILQLLYTAPSSWGQIHGLAKISISGSDNETGHCIVETHDAQYAITGIRNEDHAFVFGNDIGERDAHITKVDNNLTGVFFSHEFSSGAYSTVGERIALHSSDGLILSGYCSERYDNPNYVPLGLDPYIYDHSMYVVMTDRDGQVENCNCSKVGAAVLSTLPGNKLQRTLNNSGISDQVGSIAWLQDSWTTIPVYCDQYVAPLNCSIAVSANDCDYLFTGSSSLGSNVSYSWDILSVGSGAEQTGPSASFNYGFGSLICTYGVQTYTVEMTVTNLLTGATCIETVQVTPVDTAPPVILNCPGPQTLAGCSNDYVLDIQFTDVCDSNPTITYSFTGAGINSPVQAAPTPTLFNPGVTTVTATVSDCLGNLAVCSFTVTFSPPPMLWSNCQTDQVVTVDNQSGIALCDDTSSDQYLTLPTPQGGCPPYTVTSSHPDGYLFPCGTTTAVSTTATDALGQSITCAWNVTVNCSCIVLKSVNIDCDPVDPNIRHFDFVFRDQLGGIPGALCLPSITSFSYSANVVTAGLNPGAIIPSSGSDPYCFEVHGSATLNGAATAADYVEVSFDLSCTCYTLGLPSGNYQCSELFQIPILNCTTPLVPGCNDPTACNYDPFAQVLDSSCIYDQEFDIDWQRVLGGSSSDYSRTMIETSDGGYLIAGTTNSFVSGEVGDGGTFGSSDGWVIKLAGDGSTIQWQRVLGGSAIDHFLHAIELSSGDFLLGGNSGSPVSGDVADGGSSGPSDMWVVSLSSDGSTINWQRMLGGSGHEGISTMVETSTGDILLGGTTNSPVSGDVADGGTAGSHDWWVLNLSSDGSTINWQRVLGGSDEDVELNIIETLSGNLLLTGSTRSPVSGEVADGGALGGADWWIVNLSSDGSTINWQRVLGGSSMEYYSSTLQLPTGEFILGGSTWSAPSGEVGDGGTSGFLDFWVVKLSNDGSGVIWQRVLGGSDVELLNSMLVTPAGKIIVGGNSGSGVNGDVGDGGVAGFQDMWVLQLSADGLTLDWQRMLGGTDYDYLNAMTFHTSQTGTTGGIVLSGSTMSPVTGEVGDGGTAGSQDIWVLKLRPDCSSGCCQDVNGDGEIGTADLLGLLANFGVSGEGLPGDCNGDNQMGTNDILGLLGLFGASCP